MSRRRRFALWFGTGILIFLFGLTIAACTANSPAARPLAVTAQFAANDQSGPTNNKAELAAGDVETTTDVQSPPITQDRIVLKNATMSITVKDPASTIDAISKIAQDQGGWIVTSNTYQQTSTSGAKQTYGSITIRIPSAKLDNILDQIKASAVSVDNINVTGEDVTDQYTDLNSQLTNLVSAQSQLQKIMDSATKTEDVLSVFNQMTTINGQIDVIKGKLKFYDESAAYSSVAVTLAPSEDSQPLAIGGWQPGNTIKTAFESLVQLLQGVADVVIWLVIVVLPFVVIVFVLYRLYRRFRPRKLRIVQPAADVGNTQDQL